MTTEQGIELQLQKEFQDFYNRIYDGKIDIPSNLIELFKAGVMSLAPQFHKINSNKLNVISKTNLRQLTNGDLKDVITIILNTPFDKLYNDFTEAMESHLRIQKFIISYNTLIDDFEKKLQMKKVTLQNLSGVNNGNNMRLVN